MNENTYKAIVSVALIAFAGVAVFFEIDPLWGMFALFGVIIVCDNSK